MGNDSSKSPSGRAKKGLGISLKSGPSSSTVQRHLENAQKSRVLQLKGCNLKSLPEQAEQVKDILRNLDLSQNRIRELPFYIGQFANLKQLHIASNVLESLPDDIGLLKNLEVLNVSDNQLRSLPESFVGLCSLKNLDLSRNKFEILPIVICHLAALENLDMSTNLIEQLPDEVKDLKASEANFNQNRLNSLNSNLAKCERLRTLRVEENCLKKTDFSVDLLSNSKVSLIAYAGNLFQDKDFQGLPGYEDYQTRFTATKRKM